MIIRMADLPVWSKVPWMWHLYNKWQTVASLWLVEMTIDKSFGYKILYFTTISEDLPPGFWTSLQPGDWSEITSIFSTKTKSIWEKERPIQYLIMQKLKFKNITYNSKCFAQYREW